MLRQGVILKYRFIRFWGIRKMADLRILAINTFSRTIWWQVWSLFRPHRPELRLKVFIKNTKTIQLRLHEEFRWPMKVAISGRLETNELRRLEREEATA